MDSETLSSETFWADSETLFVGFTNFFRRIEKLFSSDSETFFVGFRNFFRRIQKLFSLDSPPLPNTDATQDLGQGSGGVGWGGMIAFLGLEQWGGVGWDDNVPWP